ncbi:MAG: XdhC family protein [Calditrichota bacterium]
MSASEFYRRVLEAVESGREAYAATLTSAEGSTPQKTGAKILIYADGSSFDTIGGGDVERKLITDVITARPREPLTIRYSLNAEAQTTADPKMMCGGSVEFYIEPLANPHQLFIIGGGHCGVELSQLAARVGFTVTVIDNRADWANAQKHPAAARTICTAYDDVESHIHFSPDAFIVIMTHGHQHDEQVLRICLRHEARFIGVIGSKRKAKTMFEHLKADGINEQDIAQVHCPIGMEIYSHTPAEIAVSIVAQLVAIKNGPPQATVIRPK